MALPRFGIYTRNVVDLRSTIRTTDEIDLALKRHLQERKG